MQDTNNYSNNLQSKPATKEQWLNKALMYYKAKQYNMALAACEKALPSRILTKAIRSNDRLSNNYICEYENSGDNIIDTDKNEWIQNEIDKYELTRDTFWNAMGWTSDEP